MKSIEAEKFVAFRDSFTEIRKLIGGRLKHTRYLAVCPIQELLSLNSVGFITDNQGREIDDLGVRLTVLPEHKAFGYTETRETIERLNSVYRELKGPNPKYPLWAILNGPNIGGDYRTERIRKEKINLYMTERKLTMIRAYVLDTWNYDLEKLKEGGKLVPILVPISRSRNDYPGYIRERTTFDPLAKPEYARDLETLAQFFGVR